MQKLFNSTTDSRIFTDWLVGLLSDVGVPITTLLEWVELILHYIDKNQDAILLSMSGNFFWMLLLFQIRFAYETVRWFLPKSVKPNETRVIIITALPTSKRSVGNRNAAQRRYLEQYRGNGLPKKVVYRIRPQDNQD